MSIIKSSKKKELEGRVKLLAKIEKILKRKRGEDTEEENVKRRREEIEREKNIQEVNPCDDTCDKCQRKFTRTSLLMRHIDKYCKHTFKFNCKICNKGFMTVRGYEEHKVQHGEKSLNVLSVMRDLVQREIWLVWHHAYIFLAVSRQLARTVVAPFSKPSPIMLLNLCSTIMLLFFPVIG